jgi:hypothetical protein
MRNRVLTAAIVGLGHVVVVILIWESRVPTETKNIVLDVGSIFFFSPTITERRSGERSGQPTLRPLRPKSPNADVSELLQSTIPSVATPPPLPESSAPSGVRWQNEITDVASGIIERARVEAGRAINRPQRSPSFSPLHEKLHTFEWISQHSQEVIDEHGVPQWVLVQPCESEFLVQKPHCTVERVLPHGLLFEYMNEQREATLQYGGPNAIP